MRLKLESEIHLPGFLFPAGEYEVADQHVEQLLALGAAKAIATPVDTAAETSVKRKRGRPAKPKIETPED